MAVESTIILPTVRDKTVDHPLSTAKFVLFFTTPDGGS